MINTAVTDGLLTCRLFVTDTKTKIQFLIDTGADVSVYPRKLTKMPNKRSQYELYAANGPAIKTFGVINLPLNFKLRRAFMWKFIVAEVSKPIIGADFLSFYGLIPDLRNKRLIDSTTNLKSNERVVHSNATSIKTINIKMKYYELLSRFPRITRPSLAGNELKHLVVHHIQTTPGPPIFHKPRRLATDD